MISAGRDPAVPVLVLRALGLGDLLVAVPALRGLRRRYPGQHIVLAAPAGLTRLALSSGAVDEVLPTATAEELDWARPAPPAVAVNLHGTGPQSHRALAETRPRCRIGYRSPGWAGPAWTDVERNHRHERERWCAMLAAFDIPADPRDLRLPAPPPPADAGVTVVHPGAAFGAKRWPPSRFAAVAAALRDRGHRIVLTGSTAERPLALAVAGAAGLDERCVLAGRTDIEELTAVVAHARLTVCGDTGVAHLASAFGTRSVVLFGPVGPEQWGPPESGPHLTLTDCTARRGDRFAADPDPALLGVQVPDVLAAVAELGG